MKQLSPVFVIGVCSDARHAQDKGCEQKSIGEEIDDCPEALLSTPYGLLRVRTTHNGRERVGSDTVNLRRLVCFCRVSSFLPS